MDSVCLLMCGHGSPRCLDRVGNRWQRFHRWVGPFYYKKGGVIIKTYKKALFQKRDRPLRKKCLFVVFMIKPPFL